MCPGAFHHNLYIFFPGTFCQFAQGDQLLDLGDIRGILDASGAAGVPETHGNVIFPADIQDFIIMLVERILLACHFHPGKDDGAAAGDDIGEALVTFEFSCGFFVDAAVDGHEVHAVLGVHAHYVKPLPGRDLF